jgi:hypothetical protein
VPVAVAGERFGVRQLQARDSHGTQLDQFEYTFRYIMIEHYGRGQREGNADNLNGESNTFLLMLTAG